MEHGANRSFDREGNEGRSSNSFQITRSAVNVKLESIACNNCGAPLQVPESVNYVTCNHCESHLAVKRDEHLTYTEKIKEIEHRTKQMQDELERLKIDNELAKLDRPWEPRKRKLHD